MSDPIFTDAWAKAWGEKLNANADYRAAAEKWEWPLVLVAEEADAGNGQEAAIYLDLWQGTCREARLATTADLEVAPYVLAGSTELWQRMLDGELDPILALMSGKLKLRKGNLMSLVRFTEAAKQLLISARQVEAEAVAESPQAGPATLAAAQAWDVAPHERFVSTGPTGLRHDILPMRLYHKAKKLGVWDPRDLDLGQDAADWRNLSDLEREVVLHLTSLFLAGEEAVTLDLLPLLMVVAREGRLEEEMYLTTFLWEEAKHTEFFRRFLDEVAAEQSDLSRFHSPAYRKLFYEELPVAMQALLTDPSPEAQVRASVTYNMIIEGTMAETGYHAYFTVLERNRIMPGLLQGIRHLQQDESRHVAYGLFLLSRLVAAEPRLWSAVEQRMQHLLESAVQSIHEVFARYETMPFGLQLEEFLDYAVGQFSKRLQKLEQAKDQTLEEIYRQTEVF